MSLVEPEYVKFLQALNDLANKRPLLLFVVVFAVTAVTFPLGRLLAVLLLDRAERLWAWASYELYLRRVWKEHRRIYGERK